LSRFGSVHQVGPLERALFLKTLGTMQALQPAEIAVFAENARESRFKAGEALFRPGHRVCSYHVIAEGGARVEGGEYPVPEEIGARGAVGFLSMLGGREEGLEAIATEETLCLTFDDDAFFDILEDNFSILMSLVRNLARFTLSERRRMPPETYLAPAEDVLSKTVSDSIDLVERIALIRRPGSPFERSSLEALARLARSTPEVRFAAGETVWRFGDVSDSAIILVAGTVACTTPNGRQLFRAGPGYPLGNLERFSGDPRWFTATAETDVLGLRGETETFFDLLEDHFDMALDFVSTMARNLVRIRRENAERGRTPLATPGPLPPGAESIPDDAPQE
jgi:CRP-like cAMP-binding protein